MFIKLLCFLFLVQTSSLWGQEAPVPLDCKEKALKELESLLKEDKHGILQKQFSLTTLKMTAKVLQKNMHTLEELINAKKNEILSADRETQVIPKLKSIYAEYGQVFDSQLLEKKLSQSSYYFKPQMRFYNKEISAFLLALKTEGKDEDIDMSDVAITWYMDKITKEMEKKYGRYSAKHNLTNLSNLLTRYTGVIKGAENLSLETVQKRIESSEQKLKGALQLLIGDFSQAFKEECLEAGKICEAEIDELIPRALFNLGEIIEEVKEETPNLVSSSTTPSPTEKKTDPEEEAPTAQTEKAKTQAGRPTTENSNQEDQDNKAEFDMPILTSSYYIAEADSTYVAPRADYEFEYQQFKKAVEKDQKLRETMTPYSEVQMQEAYLNSLADEETIVEFNKNKKLGNYAVVDKKKNLLTLYSSSGDVISTMEIGIGKKAGDERTKSKNTQTEEFNIGKTGAGIYEFSRQGTGGNYKKYYDDNIIILKDERGNEQAMSIHQIPVGCVYRAVAMDNDNAADNRYSDGCINLASGDMGILMQHIKEGSQIYVLPEDKSNEFVVKDDKLHFTTYDKKNDYGVFNYSPRQSYNSDIHFVINNKKLETPLVKGFAQTLETEKEEIRKLYNLTDKEYNDLAQMALGVMGNESQFGESKRYKAKTVLGEENVAALRTIRDNMKNGEITPLNFSYLKIRQVLKEDTPDTNLNAAGPTQIKKIPEKIKEHYNIEKLNLKDPKWSAVATMGFLAESLEQLKSQEKVFNAKNAKIKITKENRLDYLPYIYMGKTREILEGTATPDKNIYIQNLKQNQSSFSLWIENGENEN